MIYQARRAPQAETLVLRDLKFQLYRWHGRDPTPPVVLVHGWGDTSETWQFVVDQGERSWVAMDMRGFGRTQRPDDGYWFPDYMADLDALLDRLSPDSPVDLVGHSMGGNIVMLYAGARPQRVRKVVSLEAFGLPRTNPQQAPARYAEWLDEVKNGNSFATYASYEQFMRVLARRNPRTPADRLEFVARSWAREVADGRIELWADPKHKRVNPVLYQRDQAEACWRAIAAPLLLVFAEESDLTKRMADEIAEDRLRALFSNVTTAMIRGAGHMIHHERPEETAALLETFLTANTKTGC
jgi:pimeloyl-ACP methyl ester carboxylesterase